MIDYNTSQWIIIHYPQAAGGKFLATCFMMFDNVANWAEQDLSANEIVNWYNRSIPESVTSWFAKEIDTPWVLPASRLWPRGSELSNSDFWAKFKPTDWFLQSWNQKKFMVDFWHKSVKPDWWSNAIWINIAIDDRKLYKKLLLSKIFEYDKESKTVTWTSQVPLSGRPAAIENKANYQNQFKWNNINDLDHFYHEFVLNHQCFDWAPEDSVGNSLAISELFDVDKLVNFLLQFEDRLSSRLNVDCVKQIHETWTSATKKLL